MDYYDFKGYTEYYQDATIIVERSEVIFKGSRTHTKKQSLKVERLEVDNVKKVIHLYIRKGLEQGYKVEQIENEFGKELANADDYAIVAFNTDEDIRYKLNSKPTYNHKRNQINFPASSKIVNSENY